MSAGTLTITVDGQAYTGGVTKRATVYIEQAIGGPITSFDPDSVTHSLAMAWAVARSNGYEGDFDSFLDASVPEFDEGFAKAFADAETGDESADPFTD